MRSSGLSRTNPTFKNFRKIAAMLSFFIIFWDQKSLKRDWGCLDVENAPWIGIALNLKALRALSDDPRFCLGGAWKRGPAWLGEGKRKFSWCKKKNAHFREQKFSILKDFGDILWISIIFLFFFFYVKINSRSFD